MNENEIYEKVISKGEIILQVIRDLKIRGFGSVEVCGLPSDYCCSVCEGLKSEFVEVEALLV